MSEDNEEYMLTTVDNPFDPFTQYLDWRAYDLILGHNTEALLGRTAVVSSDLSEEDQDFAVQSAIDEIIEYNVTGVFTKVKRTSKI